MLFHKPLEEITANDLQALIDNQVAERRTIEYKRDLPGNSYKDRKEFLADVSSFANTAGGYLIYGIDAKDGVPKDLCGVEIANLDEFKLTCENRLRGGLSPQIPSVDIESMELTSGRKIIIIRIQQSWLAPHRVTLENHGHFYGRNSAGHFQMDVPQLRAAFELSGTITERIRSFRAERLSRINSGEETPAPLNDQNPKLVLHLIPLNAFSTTISLDFKSLLNDPFKGKLLEPLSFWDIEPHVTMRFNLDGIMRSTKQERNSSETIGYTQVFRNGIIETVDMSLLGIFAQNTAQNINNVDPMGFNGEKYERKVLATVKRYIDLQKFLGIEPPFFIMLSFLGVKGHKIWHPIFNYELSQYTDEIDRANLIIPEVMVENFDVNLAEVMKPIFDTVWNGAGYIGSPNYDAAGKFKFGY